MRVSLLRFVTWGVCVLAAATAVSRADDPRNNAMERWAESQLRLTVDAYLLTEAEEAALRAEMEARVRQQREFEARTNPKLEELYKAFIESGGQPGSSQDKALTQYLEEVVNTQPLDDNAMMSFVSSRVDEARARDGAERFHKLVERRQAVQEAQAGDLESRAAYAKFEESARVSKTAPLTEGGNPMPIERAAAAPRQPDEDVVTVKRSVSAGATRRSGPGAVGPESGAAPGAPGPVRAPTPAAPSVITPPPPAAPPLDQWDKHLDRTSEQYGFGDEQRTKAQSILRDIRKRAEQYRLSYAAEFERAERIEAAKERSERLKELNAPIDALFDELKQRVDNLATVEQRERASKAGAKPK